MQHDDFTLALGKLVNGALEAHEFISRKKGVFGSWHNVDNRIAQRLVQGAVPAGNAAEMVGKNVRRDPIQIGAGIVDVRGVLAAKKLDKHFLRQISSSETASYLSRQMAMQFLAILCVEPPYVFATHRIELSHQQQLLSQPHQGRCSVAPNRELKFC